MSAKTAFKSLPRKLLIFGLFILFILIVKTQVANAVAPTASTSPAADGIDETVSIVNVTYSGLTPGMEYAFCYTGDCDVFNYDKKITANGDGTKQIPVCGDGDSSVVADTDCTVGSNYFHAGGVYTPTVGNLVTNLLIPAQFFVHPYYPETVNITPKKPVPGQPLTVSISQKKLRAGSVARDDRNAYKIILDRNDGNFSSDSDCVKITQPNVPITLSITPIDAGEYTLSVQGCGKNQDALYYQTLIAVDATDGKVGELIKNEGIDQPDESMLSQLPPPPPPCAKFGVGGDCESVGTAIGDIDTSPGGFVTSVFSLILSLSGGLALILIIYGGFQLMMARGKPEAMEAARDQITAAIIGLLFIIFSLVLLQVIGVDILKIPGFEGHATFPAPPTGSDKSLFQ